MAPPIEAKSLGVSLSARDGTFTCKSDSHHSAGQPLCHVHHHAIPNESVTRAIFDLAAIGTVASPPRFKTHEFFTLQGSKSSAEIPACVNDCWIPLSRLAASITQSGNAVEHPEFATLVLGQCLRHNRRSASGSIFTGVGTLRGQAMRRGAGYAHRLSVSPVECVSGVFLHADSIGRSLSGSD